MTSETNLREYIVTLHQFDDLESFYTDMETEGGNLYIPNRAVDVALRRPISRNTHYMLSDQEAEQLRQDTRVLAVELTLKEQGIEIEPAWTQYSTRWSKLETVDPDVPAQYQVTSGQYNWGLLRTTEGVHRPNWGSPRPIWRVGYITPGAIPEVEGTVTVPFSGKNVDVVILDGMLEAEHPEFAKNIDGTGGSRVVPYNWYALNSVVQAPADYPTNYPYAPADRYNDYHGTHVAGTVAGNTQGWARDANIYNMYIYNRYEPKTRDDLQFDYIRAWHNNKPINPATGRKNPTIVNCSWIVGNGLSALPSWIKSIRYRGTVYNGPFTDAQLLSYGVPYQTLAIGPNRNTALETDIAQCIADGIIVVAAAGNDNFKVSLPSTNIADDYNNYFYWEFTSGGSTLVDTKYYNRGSSPAAAPGAISVGAIGNYAGSLVNFLEEKAPFSNCGPRIDVFAPGSGITSAVNNNWREKGAVVDGVQQADTIPVTAADPRNSAYKTVSIGGTSMASPQVTGVLATLLEMTPTLTAAQALSYLVNNAKQNQLYDTTTTGTVADFFRRYTYDLQGATNRTLFSAYPTIMAITPSTAVVTPSQSVVYTITMTGALDGSLVYLTDSGTSLSTDFNDGVRQFVLTVNGGTASLTRTVSSGITGSRTSILQLRTGGYDGNIQSTASTVTVSISDFSSNSGSFTIDAQGNGVINITPALDSVTDGAETFTLSIRTGSISGNVVKTSDPITINDA